MQLPLPLELLIPHQPVHQRGVTDPVVAADQKGLQGAGISIFHGGMLGQFAKLPEGGRADPEQPADLPRSVDRPGVEALGPEQGLKQSLGLPP